MMFLWLQLIWIHCVQFLFFLFNLCFSGADPDGGSIRYSISGPTFSVDRDTGVVRLRQELDREKQNSIEVIISITGLYDWFECRNELIVWVVGRRCLKHLHLNAKLVQLAGLHVLFVLVSFVILTLNQFNRIESCWIDTMNLRLTYQCQMWFLVFGCGIGR